MQHELGGFRQGLGQVEALEALEMLRSGNGDDLLDFDALEALLGEDLAEDGLLGPGGGPSFPQYEGTGQVVDVDQIAAAAAQAAAHAAAQAAMPGPSSDASTHVQLPVVRSASGTNESRGGAGRASKTGPGSEDFNSGDEEQDGRTKKKRTRNSEQMKHNRIAQAKYRERKKQEQAELQAAVDRMTAQLAALKAIEVRAHELETHNSALATTVAQQQGMVQHLEQQVQQQQVTISAQAKQATEQAEVITKQQHMILDQHRKLQMQEEIITQLKERLRDSVDEAWNTLGSKDPASVCKRMHLAVKQALEGAKDMQGIMDNLEAIPDHLVVEICKNILHQCKDMWPHPAFDSLDQHVAAVSATCRAMCQHAGSGK